MIPRKPASRLIPFLPGMRPSTGKALPTPMDPWFEALPVAVRFDLSFSVGSKEIPASTFLWISRVRTDRSVKALRLVLLEN